MRQSFRKTLLWQAVGLLCSLVGMVLVVLVAVGVFLAPPENSLANITTGDVVVLLIGASLLASGRVISWKAGGETATMFQSASTVLDRGPDQSRLQELGYQVPPEEPEDANTDSTGDGGEASRRCTECGTTNQQAFRYCSNCSSRLPE